MILMKGPLHHKMKLKIFIGTIVQNTIKINKRGASLLHLKVGTVLMLQNMPKSLYLVPLRQ